MKTKVFFLFIPLFFCFNVIYSQTEKVIIDGGVQVGTVQDAPAVAGTIRWNPNTQDFEGFNGSEWVSLTFSPDQWGVLENNVSENNFIASNNPTANAAFGNSIDIDGDYIIIGEPGVKQAYIIKKTSTSWEIDTILTNVSGSVVFGNHVAINGEYAMVSTADSVKVYLRTGEDWNLTTTLAPMDNPTTLNSISSIDLKSDRVIIGMRAYFGIFERTGTTWNRTASIPQPVLNYNHEFGWAVAIYDTTAVVSAFLENSSKGAAYIYKKEAGTWGFVQKLTPTGTFDGQFGFSVEIDSKYVYVGMKFAVYPMLGPDDQTGSVEVFSFSGGVWNLEDRIFPPVYSGDEEYFGSSMDIKGSTLIIGAPAIQMGWTYFYKKIGAEWYYQAKFIASDGTNGDFTGMDTAISGDCAIISGQSVNHDGIFDSGKVYIVRK